MKDEIIGKCIERNFFCISFECFSNTIDRIITLGSKTIFIKTKSMNFIQYLQRLQVKKTENPSYSFLSKLQEQHLLTIPFENLDIHQGKKIVLNDHRRKLKEENQGCFR